MAQCLTALRPTNPGGAAEMATLGERFGVHPATLVLATAPGGIAEMCITAKVLQLGVPVVTAFQVTRVAILLTCTLPMYRRWRRWRNHT